MKDLNLTGGFSIRHYHAAIYYFESDPNWTRYDFVQEFSQYMNSYNELIESKLLW